MISQIKKYLAYFLLVFILLGCYYFGYAFLAIKEELYDYFGI
jgi:hypothetical protein